MQYLTFTFAQNSLGAGRNTINKLILIKERETIVSSLLQNYKHYNTGILKAHEFIWFIVSQILVSVDLRSFQNILKGHGCNQQGFCASDCISEKISVTHPNSCMDSNKYVVYEKLRNHTKICIFYKNFLYGQKPKAKFGLR